MTTTHTTARRTERADGLLARFERVRSTTDSLCESLSAEDMVVQAYEETSPTKWHLAHTTWFFETFVLERYERGFRPFDPDFRVLFNSYYQTLGDRHPRAERGMLTRPGLGEVIAYRDTVDERIAALLGSATQETVDGAAPLIELGLQHEQQHQELILMDIKRLLSRNPTRPAYRPDAGGAPDAGPGPALEWVGVEGGLVEIGHDPDGRFAYDNEGPRHKHHLEPFEIASRPVTNAEFAAFVADGGYERPELWLDEAWATICAERWAHPIYWRRDGDRWAEFTLRGERELDPDAPACHLSFYEAEAYARWAGARMPTEAEWEAAAGPRWDEAVGRGRFLEDGDFHPERRETGGPLHGIAGGVWEWTRSAHEPYPGYAPPAGAVGEYNGKFMCGSFVLRGGCCVTPRDHLRVTYRNFFRPGARWAFSGVRLARGGEPGGRGRRTTRASRPESVRPTIRGRQSEESLESDALEGLTRTHGTRILPAKHLYDARGSELFERICEQDEYYVTRTENRILDEAGASIAEAVGPGAVLIEPGAGDGTKARRLLEILDEPRMFVPVEISPSALETCVDRVAGALPGLAVQPVCAGFTEGMELLAGQPRENRLVYFAGSTIGNTDRAGRASLLRSFARAAGGKGRVLVGFDMVKDKGVLEAAYDDAGGVSAAFGRNLIHRLNRELDAGLDEDAFRYEADWRADEKRIRMSLVCERDQRATIAGRDIPLDAGDRIVTEYSHKFTDESIAEEAAAAGLRPLKTWTDPDGWFSLVLFGTTGEADDARR